MQSLRWIGDCRGGSGHSAARGSDSGAKQPEQWLLERRFESQQSARRHVAASGTSASHCDKYCDLREGSHWCSSTSRGSHVYGNIHHRHRDFWSRRVVSLHLSRTNLRPRSTQRNHKSLCQRLGSCSWRRCETVATIHRTAAKGKTAVVLEHKTTHTIPTTAAVSQTTTAIASAVCPETAPTAAVCPETAPTAAVCQTAPTVAVCQTAPTAVQTAGSPTVAVSVTAVALAAGLLATAVYAQAVFTTAATMKKIHTQSSFFFGTGCVRVHEPKDRTRHDAHSSPCVPGRRKDVLPDKDVR